MADRDAIQHRLIDDPALDGMEHSAAGWRIDELPQLRVAGDLRVTITVFIRPYGTDSGPGNCRGNHVRRASDSAVATTEGSSVRVPLARTVVACPVHTT
jgi:hypothetical protein